MTDEEKSRMAELKRFFRERDRFGAHNGMELVEIAPGRARVKMQIGENHLNGIDRVHGGAVFSLADLAFAAASNSHGFSAVGINANIAYVKEASGDVLYAEAEEVSRSGRLATYSIRVTDETGQCVAVFQGTVYRRKGYPIPPADWQG